MLTRPAWGALYERDLDLILLDLLHSDAAFRGKLLSTVAPDIHADPDADFVGAWHSVIDDLGHESDIEAEWRTPDGTFTLLIEDKLGARCQPDQAVRYLARASRYRESGRAAATRTLLVAPAAYPAQHADDTEPFEAHLAIEHIGGWVEAAAGRERGRYLTRMLQHAIDRVTRSRIGRPAASPTDTLGGESPSAARDSTTPGVEGVLTPVYATVREILSQLGSDLTITSSGTWMYFTFPERRPNVLLRYRIPDAWAELSIVKKAVPEERVTEAFRAHPLQGGDVSTRGKTETAIWMPVPEVDLDAGVAGQRDRLVAAVGVVETLKRWYVHHATLLHGSPIA